MITNYPAVPSARRRAELVDLAGVTNRPSP
jgi:hypothetical protein